MTRKTHPAKVSNRTVERLSLYRELLNGLGAEGRRYIYSHELAALAGSTAVQVRRDLMTIGFSGNTAKGYDRAAMIEGIGRFLDDPQGVNVALVGIGNLGRAIMAFFAGRRPKLTIVAAFDNDPAKANRVIYGCPCCLIDELPRIVDEMGIRVGIIAVPAPAAQEVAERLVEAGVRGIVNFAPVRLHVSSGVHVQNLDMTTALETTAYLARKHVRRRRPADRPAADPSA